MEKLKKDCCCIQTWTTKYRQINGTLWQTFQSYSLFVFCVMEETVPYVYRDSVRLKNNFKFRQYQEGSCRQYNIFEYSFVLQRFGICFWVLIARNLLKDITSHLISEKYHCVFPQILYSDKCSVKNKQLTHYKYGVITGCSSIRDLAVVEQMEDQLWSTLTETQETWLQPQLTGVEFSNSEFK